MDLLTESLKCGICFEIFDDVVETPCCGHGYCRKCLTQSLAATAGKCPSCRGPIRNEEMRKNQMVQRMVDLLPIDCPNRGCYAKINRGILLEHRCVCPFELVTCQNSPSCGLIERRQYSLHLVRCEHKDHPKCEMHNEREKILLCLLDHHLLCPACALLGSHRHHRCFPVKSIQQATLATSSVAIATSLPTLSSVGYWISFAQGITASVDFEIANPSTNQPAQAPTSQVSCRSKPFEILPSEHLPLSYALAALLCGPNLSEESLRNLLHVQRVEINQAYLKLFSLPQVYEIINGSPHPSFKVSSKAPDSEDLKSDLDHYKKKFQDLFDFQGVQVKTRSLSKYVKIGEINRIFLMLEVLSGRRDQDEQERIPFSLVIVLDRSGSMSGEKLSKCISAIISCIERLGPNDVLHLVIYDDVAKTIFENGRFENRADLISQVQGVKVGGGTNITVGLECGFRILQKENDGTRLKRLFLFSDGVSTTRTHEIIPTVQQMKDANIVVSSFGIGADFDEKIMKGVADAGTGNYFFISDSGSIPMLVEKGMKGMERIIGTNANIWMRGLQGEEIRKVKGDSSSEFFLGDLRENGMKQMLVEMDWNGKNSPALDGQQVQILSYDVTYLADGREPITLSGVIELEARASWEVFAEDFDPAVDVQLTIHEVSQLDKLALTEIDQKNIAGALSLKRASQEMLERAKKIDEIGYTTALLMKCRERIKELEEQLHNSRNRNYAALRKQVHKEIMEEDDCDMGFGLFD